MRGRAQAGGGQLRVDVGRPVRQAVGERLCPGRHLLHVRGHVVQGDGGGGGGEGVVVEGGGVRALKGGLHPLVELLVVLVQEAEMIAKKMISKLSP